MENSETVLQELEDIFDIDQLEFNKSASDAEIEIPQKLEEFIEYVAKTGVYLFPWVKVRKLYLNKLKIVLDKMLANAPTTNSNNLNESSSGNSNDSSTLMSNSSDSNNLQLIKDRLIQRMESFTSAPFTIQRISELLLKPNSHYNRTDKFIRGLEKCVMVVTTVDSLGNKIFIDNLFEEETKENGFELKTPVRPKTPPHIQENNDMLTNSDNSNNVELTEVQEASDNRPESPDQMPIEVNTNEKENMQQINDKIEQHNDAENNMIQSEDIEFT